MALTVRYVTGLKSALDSIAAFLSRDSDLFARPRIVVPNAGTKTWLQDRLARRLGAAGRDDGIIANVEFAYPGAILAACPPPIDDGDDPWAFDRLAFTLLGVFAADGGLANGIPFDTRREPLLTARRIAGLFDEYHVRRPGMIREWAREPGNPVLAPTADDQQRDGSTSPDPLAEPDRWQFDLWQRLRREIGLDSPPVRAIMNLGGNPAEPLLVVGLESLSHPQLECLDRLGQHANVEVLLVHPSPGLRAARGNPPRVTSTLPARRPRDPEFPDGVDPLLPTWLAGASELDDLLRTRGVVVAADPVDGGLAPAESLLGRMQRSIGAGRIVESRRHDPGTDRSLVIHRCHTLSRQAEVIHAALLRAFEELDGLDPRDVIIVSPRIEQAAPHLRAAFERTVIGKDRRGREQRISLPLVIADRAIRESSEAADLLVSLLAIPGSRAGIDDVLAVVGHPLVRQASVIGDDDFEKITDLLDRAAVRWGLDAVHRARHGLALTTHADIHTWRYGLERMLMGAILPDAPACPELGGVVPLSGLAPEDVALVAKLVRILAVIRTLDATVADRRATAEWCDAIERALLDLCGEESPQLAEPLSLLRRLRSSATGTIGERTPVPFEDIRRLLVEWMEAKSGRQPLRTGAITATSMVPLRGVPFRVVVVIGYDDGAVSTGEADGDDLVARQRLLGDEDPRIDIRRSLLDCVLTAEDRLVVACNGRSAKSNNRVPLVTPLSELVDFAVRHGVVREAYDAPSAIEIDHPRHHLDQRNFEEGGVEKVGVWSHDTTAAKVIAAAKGAMEPTTSDSSPTTAAATTPAAEAGPTDAPSETPVTVELSLIERMIKDPLQTYLQKTLGLDTWRDDKAPVPATIPLEIPRSRASALTLELAARLAKDRDSAEAWLEARQRSGDLPIVSQALPSIAEILLLAAGLVDGAGEEGLDFDSRVTVPLDHVTVGRHRFVGSLPGIDRDRKVCLTIRASDGDIDATGRPLHTAALHLLAARSAGIDVERAVVLSRRDKWRAGMMKPPSNRFPEPRPVEPWQVRIISLDETLSAPEAAARRLDAIADLAREATTQPRPVFGGMLTATPEGRRRAFDQCVGRNEYGWISERLYFGPNPRFDEIFVAHPERMAFVDTLQRLLQPRHVHGKKYILA